MKISDTGVELRRNRFILANQEEFNITSFGLQRATFVDGKGHRHHVRYNHGMEFHGATISIAPVNGNGHFTLDIEGTSFGVVPIQELIQNRNYSQPPPTPRTTSEYKAPKRRNSIFRGEFLIHDGGGFKLNDALWVLESMNETQAVFLSDGAGKMRVTYDCWVKLGADPENHAKVRISKPKSHPAIIFEYQCEGEATMDRFVHPNRRSQEPHAP